MLYKKNLIKSPNLKKTFISINQHLYGKLKYTYTDTRARSKEIINLLKEHKKTLKKYKVKKIGLFGSFARGDQKRHSYIDFLVEFEEPTFDNLNIFLMKLIF